MKEIYEYLHGLIYFIATEDGDQARVRPFGSLYLYEDKLYISTSRGKNVYDQLKKAPKIEMAALMKEGWIRITAEAVEEERLEIRELLWRDSAKRLPNRDPDHMADTMAAFYLQNGTATIFRDNAEPEVFTF